MAHMKTAAIVAANKSKKDNYKERYKVLIYAYYKRSN